MRRLVDADNATPAQGAPLVPRRLLLQVTHFFPIALSRTGGRLRLYYVGPRRGSPVPRTIAMKYLLMMQFPLKEWKTSRIDSRP
jgi:hypothetical protein